MSTVFRIDVSETTSEIGILVNGEKVQGYSIPNNTIDFSRLFHILLKLLIQKSILSQQGYILED
mgnify:CR=1 FL=1